MFKKTGFFMMACVFTLSINTSSFAQSISELERERNEAAGEVKETQEQLDSILAEMAKVQADIKQLDERLTKATDELTVIDEKLLETEELLEQVELELAQAQQDRDGQFEAFRERMRFMHEYGQASFLEVLFQATDVRDFLVRLEYVNEIAKSDQEMVDRMQQAEDKVAEKVDEVDKQKNSIETLQHRQIVLMEELEITLADQRAYVEKLDLDEDSYRAKLEQEKEDERIIQAALAKAKAEEEARRQAALAEEEARRKANRPPVVTGGQLPAAYNGSMGWPAPSYKSITSNYGTRTHPITGRKETHSGVDLASNSGNNILAADSGEVILAGYNGGYGNCVIISHGGGVSTLYGHASKLLVSEGQRVSKGEVIAKVGSTGISTGPHLHFEVRINGNHTSPQPYLGY